ncbi:MAG: hypothetical protein KAH32_06015 [Chlamydiia bacterium]|nr:hypothetical protein [Chlamydiia bacterium]
MNTSVIENTDSHGALANDIYKVFPKESACVTTLVGDTDMKGVKMVYSNMDFAAIPGLDVNNATCYFIHSYNGTMYKHNKLFRQEVYSEVSIFNKNVLPTYIYNPPAEAVKAKNIESGEAFVEVDFRTGEAGLLQLKGTPVGGNNAPFLARYSFPARIDSPNYSDSTLYLDGWYTSEFLIFKDVSSGMRVAAGMYVSHKGQLMTILKDGIIVMVYGETFILIGNDGMIISGGISYTVDKDELLMYAYTKDSADANATFNFVATQTLITYALNENLIKEIMNGAADVECDKICTIADWQRLQQKKIGAHIQFINGNYRKAQVIVESARTSCNNRNFKDCN